MIICVTPASCKTSQILSNLLRIEISDLPHLLVQFGRDLDLVWILGLLDREIATAGKDCPTVLLQFFICPNFQLQTLAPTYF